MRKILGLLLLLLLLFHVSPSYSQSDNTIERLDKVKVLFDSKDYDRAISEIDSYLNSSLSIKDSLYIEFLEYKFLCYNWKHQNTEGLPVLLDAISICESFQKDSRQLCALYRRYLRIFTAQKTVAQSLDYAHKLLSSRFFSYSDYQLYGTCIEKFCIDTDYDKKTAFLNEENEFVTKANKKYLQAFFLYEKGKVLSEKSWGNATFFESEEAISSSLEILKAAVESLDNSNDQQIALYCNWATEKAIELLLDKGAYKSAAIYCEKRLAALSKYWQQWNLETPWEDHAGMKNFAHSKIGAFTEYEETLESLQDYSSIAKLCKQIISSEAFGILKDDQKIYISKVYFNALEEIGTDQTMIEQIKDSISASFDFGLPLYVDIESDVEERLRLLFSSGDYNETSFLSTIVGWSYINDDFYEVCDYLAENKYYTLLEKYAYNKYNEYIIDTDKIIAEQIIFDENKYNFNDLTSIQKQLAADRETWHYANLGSECWKSLYYIAKACFLQDKFNEAIFWQKYLIDILSCECSLTNAKRDEFYKYGNTNNLICEYLKTEIDQIFILAKYQISDHQYDNAYQTLKKVLSLNEQYLSFRMAVSDTDIRYSVWEQNCDIYYKIFESITESALTYTPFREILFRSSYVLNDYMISYGNSIRKAVYSTTQKSLLSSLEKMTIAERGIEDLHYSASSDKANDLKHWTEIYDRERGFLESALGLENHTSLLHFSLDEVKQNLHENEVFVSFISVPKDTADINHEILRIEKIINATSENNYVGNFVFNDDIYALVLRHNWEFPLLIKTGDVSDLYNKKEDNEGAWYTLYMEDSDIDSIHNQTKYFDLFWKNIVESAKIREGESILFVPCNVMNRIAIEYVPYDTEKRMNEAFDMYRLTTPRSVINRIDNLLSNCKFSVIGILNYSSQHSPKRTESFSEKRNTSAFALIDRKQLPDMRYSYQEVEHIVLLCNRIGIPVDSIWGNKGSLLYFDKIDMDSPSILHISTHGYNGTSNVHDSNMNTVLYGDREGVSDWRLKNMFETGLYLSSSSGSYTKDGYLSALGISKYDLSQTKLAVLSACSSVAGTVSRNEGVIGLLRGLKISGVKCVVGSLWDVDDHATSILLQAFYDSLFEGNSICASLRYAQNVVKNYTDPDTINIGDEHIYSDPYYWAGFVIYDGLQYQ